MLRKTTGVDHLAGTVGSLLANFSRAFTTWSCTTMSHSHQTISHCVLGLSETTHDQCWAETTAGKTENCPFKYWRKTVAYVAYTHLMATQISATMDEDKPRDDGVACKSFAPYLRQITTPAPHLSVFLQAGCSSWCSTNSVNSTEGLYVAYLAREQWHRDNKYQGSKLYPVLRQFAAPKTSSSDAKVLFKHIMNDVKKYW